MGSVICTVMGYRGREGKRIDAKRPVTRSGDKKAEHTALTVKEAQALIAQPDMPQGRRDRVLMCLLLYHGLRCEEVQLLQVASVDGGKGEFIFAQPKVDGELRHKMHLETHLAIAAYFKYDYPKDGQSYRLKPGPLLLGSRKGGQLMGTMSKSAINQRVRTLGEQIGVENCPTPLLALLGDICFGGWHGSGKSLKQAVAGPPWRCRHGISGGDISPTRK